MSNIIEAQFKIDLDVVTNAIENAGDLAKDNEVFAQLADIQRAKQKLKVAQEEFDQVEQSAKRAINDRAKALYGPEWSAIKGEGYKITRSGTGSVYQLQTVPTEEPTALDLFEWVIKNEGLLPYIKLAISADAGALEDYVVAHSALPDGVERNPNRGEMIRITVDKGLL